MQVFVINPNATQAMTDMAALTARRVAAADTVIRAGTGRGPSPVSIEGFSDEALSVPSMLEQIRLAESEGAQATVIACFDDPGLDAAREVATGPVIGICQAGVQAAMVVAKRFSVVTTLPRSVPAIEDLVHRYGASRHCRRVRCIDLPVLSIDSDQNRAFSLLVAEITRARDEDGAEAVLLGCAGMSEMAESLSKATGVVVIDGVVVAVKQAEALVGSRLLTSKANAYAYPRVKA
ncbi:aspartate/glutamate racemase family protein [Paracoccus xiamenensis]|uniref:aspartate/glutamate racemase family protein n=1 Tax=Paracoccus xiamenensis TaxID=2714901 RepID=UPI00140854EA|nr:aspartate/glutamate racemase family protein [Paracoccus xiamenensis]NHF74441.1 aspartate/glutamate racemase family protein [Paracoccus xiamenensis]